MKVSITDCFHMDHMILCKHLVVSLCHGTLRHLEDMLLVNNWSALISVFGVFTFNIWL